MQYNHGSRSPYHRRTTTAKIVFSSRRNVVSDGSYLTDEGRLFNPCTCRCRSKATGKGTVAERERLVDRGTLPTYHQHNGCISKAESADNGVECRRRQMSRDNSQRGKTALFHEGSGRPKGPERMASSELCQSLNRRSSLRRRRHAPSHQIFSERYISKLSAVEIAFSLVRLAMNKHRTFYTTC